MSRQRSSCSDLKPSRTTTPPGTGRPDPAMKQAAACVARCAPEETTRSYGPRSAAPIRTASAIPSAVRTSPSFAVCRRSSIDFVTCSLDLVLNLYNTLTGRKEAVVPENGTVKIYSCGPTVYRPVHIGNLRSFLLSDIVARAITYRDVEVYKVMNITDVGHMTDELTDDGRDKMLLAADDEGLSTEQIAAKYTNAFHEDIAAVNIKPADVYPKATEHVPQIIELIAKLIERGHAYEVGGTVYYDVTTFPAYGRLSHQSLDDMRAGHRIEEVDSAKRHHQDFVLWRAAGPRRELVYDSPWGPGYPGWHIECSAMSLEYLGERFDIHTAGIDNVFPHHEDEIAQGTAAFGRLPARHWAHGAHLTVDGRRMAKSTGNVIRIADMVERGIEPLAFRYLCLTARYRARLNFTWAAAEAAAHALDRLRRSVEPGPAAATLNREAVALDQAFCAGLQADLDTPAALVVLERMLASRIPPGEKRALLRRWDRVLGLDLGSPQAGRQAPDPEEEELLRARSLARHQRDYAEADRLRGLLAARGVELADSPAGTRWRRSTVTGSSRRGEDELERVY